MRRNGEIKTPLITQDALAEIKVISVSKEKPRLAGESARASLTNSEVTDGPRVTIHLFHYRGEKS